MVTKSQEKERANMSAELKKLQQDFFDDWVSGSLPAIWDQIPQLHPLQPEKIEITLTLDEDMIIWFRKLGRGYQARINSILRVYWHALLSGQVKAHWDAQAVAPRENSMLEEMLQTKLREIKDGSVRGASEEDLAEMEKELTESLQTIQRIHKDDVG